MLRVMTSLIENSKLRYSALTTGSTRPVRRRVNRSVGCVAQRDIKMKIIAFLFFVFVLAGCATGEKAARVNPGMSQPEVTEVMGKPDGFQRKGEYVVYKYTNRLISGWSWDRADYS